MFNPENGFPIKSWYEDKEDKELLSMIPILEFLSLTDDVRAVIPKMVSSNQLSYSKAHSLINEQKRINDTKDNDPKENKDLSGFKSQTDRAPKKKEMQIGIGANLKKGDTNIRLINLYVKDYQNNYIQSLLKDKDPITTKNKFNMFKVSNCKNDLTNINQGDLTTPMKNTQLIERGNGNQIKKNDFMQTIKFNYLQNEKEREKSSIQYLKLKLGKYTNLVDKKESELVNNKDKLRPSSSAAVLRDTNLNNSSKKFLITPSTLKTVNIMPSFVNNSLYKQQYTNNKLRDNQKRSNVIKGFGSETPKGTFTGFNQHCSSLQCVFKRTNMANTTRNNSNNTHQGLKIKTNIDLINK